MGNRTKIQQVSWNSYTAVIPKWIIGRLKLQKGDVLEWDIDDKGNLTVKTILIGERLKWSEKP